MLVQPDDSRLAEAGTTTVATRGSFSSWREVSYSCGSCGYELNLSSADRNTSDFGSKYGKAIRKGFISFFTVDESRFSKKDYCECFPCLFSRNPWRICPRRTKLLCQKCRNFIGVAYEEDDSNSRRYKIKIRALQPSTMASSSFD